MMSRNVRGFMSLFHSDKPVVCKVHGFCVAGGTDMALCSDLLVIADDAQIGYPPARVWGVPTTALWAFRIGAQRAKRLLFTGDCCPAARPSTGASRSRRRRRTSSTSASRPCSSGSRGMPVNQLVMMKLLVNQTLYAQGLQPRSARARSSTASRATPTRATRSSAARPRPACARRSRSATPPTTEAGAQPQRLQRPFVPLRQPSYFAATPA